MQRFAPSSAETGFFKTESDRLQSLQELTKSQGSVFDRPVSKAMFLKAAYFYLPITRWQTLSQSEKAAVSSSLMDLLQKDFNAFRYFVSAVSEMEHQVDATNRSYHIFAILDATVSFHLSEMMTMIDDSPFYRPEENITAMYLLMNHEADEVKNALTTQLLRLIQHSSLLADPYVSRLTLNGIHELKMIDDPFAEASYLEFFSHLTSSSPLVLLRTILRTIKEDYFDEVFATVKAGKHRQTTNVGTFRSFTSLFKFAAKLVWGRRIIKTIRSEELEYLNSYASELRTIHSALESLDHLDMNWRNETLRLVMMAENGHYYEGDSPLEFEAEDATEKMIKMLKRPDLFPLNELNLELKKLGELLKAVDSTFAQELIDRIQKHVPRSLKFSQTATRSKPSTRHLEDGDCEAPFK